MKQKTLIWIVVILAIAGIGYWYWKKKTNNGLAPVEVDANDPGLIQDLIDGINALQDQVDVLMDQQPLAVQHGYVDEAPPTFTHG